MSSPDAGTFHGPATAKLLGIAAAFALVVSAFIPPDDLFGDLTFEVHLLALVPAAGLAYVFALGRREWRLLAAPAAIVVAEGVSWGLSVTTGQEPWLFSLGSLVIVLVLWAPWPPLRSPAVPEMLFGLSAWLPALVLLTAAVSGTMTAVPSSLLAGRLAASGNANELAWTALLGTEAALWLVIGAGARPGEPVRATAHTSERLWAVLAGTNTIMLGLTGSRAAGGLGVIVLGWAVWCFRGRHAHRDIASLLARVLLMLLVALAAPRAIARSAAGGDGEPDGSEWEAIAGIDANGRREIWEAFIREGRVYFDTGGGLGRTHRLSQTFPDLPPGLPPHNEYLWLLISVGAMGTLLVALGWFLVLRRRLAWSPPRSPFSPLLWSLPVLALVDNALTAMPLTMPLMILTSATAATSAAAGSPTRRRTPAGGAEGREGRMNAGPDDPRSQWDEAR